MFNSDKPTPAQIHKAQRRLNSLVGDGRLVPREGGPNPRDGKPEKVYHAAVRGEPRSNHGAITRPPAGNGNHDTDEQSRDDASSQVIPEGAGPVKCGSARVLILSAGLWGAPI